MDILGSNKSEWDFMKVTVTADVDSADSSNQDQFRQIEDFKYTGN